MSVPTCPKRVCASIHVAPRRAHSALKLSAKAHAMNLLIVEDSEQMRRTIKTFVRDLASEIHECADGAEALAAYRAHRPDWVLMDIRVGRVDGITATRQIKAADAAARIVIVTNYDDAD